MGGEHAGHQEEHHRSHRSYLREAYRLGKLAVPLFLGSVLANCSAIVTAGFVGHLQGDRAALLLSSLVLGSSMASVTGFLLVGGAASVIETLCGQAFGAGNYRAMQDTLQRALLIMVLLCAPITVMWVYAAELLTLMGQPHDIAHGAARYLVLTLPALYLYCIHECVDKYLLSQRVVKPSLAITAATTALTPLLAWLFVVKQDMGLEGAAYAYVGAQACSTLLILCYLTYRELVYLPDKQPEGWTPFRPSLGALKNWGPYTHLAVPAVMSYCMEGWATEVLIFFAGLLPNAEVAVGVTGITLQFSTLVWLAAAAMGGAASTRVANKLGHGDAVGAKLTTRTAAVCVLVSQALIGVVAYICRAPLLSLMTNNPEIIDLALRVMPALACCFIADGLNVVQGAVLQGAGRQWWSACLNMLGWWGVGVPLAYFFGIVHGANAPGLWAGFAVASSVKACLEFGLIAWLVDWHHEVHRAAVMMRAHCIEESMLAKDSEELSADIEADMREHLLDGHAASESEEEELDEFEEGFLPRAQSFEAALLHATKREPCGYLLRSTSAEEHDGVADIRGHGWRHGAANHDGIAGDGGHVWRQGAASHDGISFGTRKWLAARGSWRPNHTVASDVIHQSDVIHFVQQTDEP